MGTIELNPEYIHTIEFNIERIKIVIGINPMALM